jgi:hypothetical protein
MSQSIEAQVEICGNFFFPKFLTSEYFEDILQKYNNDVSLKVESVDVGPCGSAGDGFASTMYRVEIHARQNNNEKLKRGNYIVKMMPTLKLAVDKLGSGSYNVQQKEMDIFQNIFPEFSRILKSVGEDKNVFPKAIAIDRKRDVLVLEDLAAKKFEMADKRVGMGMNQLKLGLTKLARFHAASIVLMEESPNIFERYDIGMFSRKTSAFHDFFGSNMDALIAEVSSWDEFEIYGKKLKNLKENMYERAYQAYDNDEGDLKVFTHGDLWINNFMFTYNKRNEANDAIIVSIFY